jgi:hypothetical protein
LPFFALLPLVLLHYAMARPIIGDAGGDGGSSLA